jgi:hypothetical protein
VPRQLHAGRRIDSSCGLGFLGVTSQGVGDSGDVYKITPNGIQTVLHAFHSSKKATALVPKWERVGRSQLGRRRLKTDLRKPLPLNFTPLITSEDGKAQQTPRLGLPFEKKE